MASSSSILEISLSQSDSDVSNVESCNNLEILSEEDGSNLFKPTSFSTPSKCSINSFNQHEKSDGEFTPEEVSFETESGEPSSVATISLLDTTEKSQQLLSVMEFHWTVLSKVYHWQKSPKRVISLKMCTILCRLLVSASNFTIFRMPIIVH